MRPMILPFASVAVPLRSGRYESVHAGEEFLVRLAFPLGEHLFVECGDGAGRGAGNSSTSVCPMISLRSC